MSVQKMEKYQEYKKNRKELAIKEKKAKKRDKILGISVGALLGLSLIVALGVTIKNSIPDYSQDQIVISDMLGVLEEETAETTE